MQAGKKIVVIPDIHETNNLARVEAAISREAPDLTVFLGDFFDQWDDNPRDAGRTAEWLAQSVKQPNRVHLFGNHDLPYAYPECPAFKCPGWTPQKYEATRGYLSEKDWASLKLAHWEGDLLFTHAGWSRNAVRVESELPQNPRAFLDGQISEAWSKVPSGGYLNDRDIAIDVLFFQVFQHGSEQLLIRFSFQDETKNTILVGCPDHAKSIP